MEAQECAVQRETQHCIHRFEKELLSLEDCGELHENEASQVVFN
jgi:hypothetical protein